MPDGKEEREERKARLEAEQNPTRPHDHYDEDSIYEGHPERAVLKLKTLQCATGQQVKL